MSFVLGWRKIACIPSKQGGIDNVSVGHILDCISTCWTIVLHRIWKSLDDGMYRRTRTKQTSPWYLFKNELTTQLSVASLLVPVRPLEPPNQDVNHVLLSCRLESPVVVVVVVAAFCMFDVASSSLSSPIKLLPVEDALTWFFLMPLPWLLLLRNPS